MQAVGRLGSYISRGVYTVSGPFHPFGGAVDIVLVEQPEGGFKSSPWYVRFGKFQGVLKAKEKVVSICVNGVEANFNMYLDHKGEAFFLREVNAEEGESMLYPSSSGDETDPQDIKRPLKSRSFNFDSNQINSMAQMDNINDRSILARTNSDQSRINRVCSLECAEIAANLLEVKWSTNLASHKPPRKDGRRTRKSLSQHVNMENALNQHKLCEEACSHNEQEGMSSKSDLEFPRGLSEDENAYTSCLSMPDEAFSSEEKTKVITEVSIRNTSEDAEDDMKVKEVLSDRTTCNLEVANRELEASVEKQLKGDVPGETSESSIGGMDCSRERNLEVTKAQEVTKNADPEMPIMEVSQTSQQKNCSHPSVSECNIADVEDQLALSKPQTVNVDLGLCSAEKADLNCAVTISSYSSLGNQALEEKVLKVEDVSSTLTSLDPGDCVLRKRATITRSASSEDEQFLFSDLDESRWSNQHEGSISPEDVDREDQLSDLDGTEKMDRLTDRNYNLHLSPENSATESQATNLEKLRLTTSTPTDIPKNKDAGEEVNQITKSLPGGMHSHDNALGQHHLCYPLSHSFDSRSQMLNSPLLGKDDLECIKSGDQLLTEEPGPKDNNGSGDSALSSSTRGNWRLWPFSFRRSKSEKVELPALDVEDTNAAKSSVDPDTENNELKPTLSKKNVRAITPTSEQLASLNLKEGKNTVTFTFSTSVLGKQQVDAQIYLWKWNTRIVISDVDGTITRSDVLGQFMPLVGVDWSQTGVAHLFSAIKENGYQLLFLSARAISQAYHTRQFLINLKQDGKVLPDGPVVISPDGLFPSLFREVIRRAPHEFKIACLEEIKALFPSDYNPFYAGFGNRDTDEISYRKVGIPKGKIFIINPKGEVVVNRCHDAKSYTSLHALVNGMFPPPDSFEQEDFNSWNYWKLPPPGIEL